MTRLDAVLSPPSPASDQVTDPVVSFSDVSLAFDEKVILRKVSFALMSGRMKIILGASGAGKSTILKMILGLLCPDAGQVVVNGHRVDALPEEELMPVRAGVGMVFQEGALFDSLTVRENVGYRLYEETDLPLEVVDTRVTEVLGFVELQEYAGRMPSELSGGQRRRVAIARALASRPRILLYDEPTTGLDPITARTIDEEIVKLRDVEGVSSIIVTHQLRDAFFIATHEAVARPDGDVDYVDVTRCEQGSNGVSDAAGRHRGLRRERRRAASLRRSVHQGVFELAKDTAMPRTRSITWSQLKVGVLGVLALVLVVVLTFAVGGEVGFWTERYPLKASFGDVKGLKPGAVVRVSGKEVGTVESVEFVGNQIDVAFELLEEVRPLVTDRSTAVIGSLSLLGEPIIDITAGAGGAPLSDWAYVRSGVDTTSFEGLSATASNSLRQVDALLAEVRAGRGTLGRLVTDDALYNELQTFVTSASAVTRAMNEGQGTIGGLLRDRKAYEALRASLENLQAVTARINSGQGALGRFLNDEALGRSISGAATNAEQITARLSKGEGTAGKLLTDQQLYDRLNSMANRVDQVVAGLEAGRGTAGLLLHDRQLYENMNRAVLEVRELIGEVRKDPRRYLNVRVSIF